MCISGGIFVSQTLVQTLTNYVHLNDNPARPTQLDIVAKIFTSLKLALSSLVAFYDSVPLSATDNADCGLPCYRSYDLTSSKPGFRYLGPLMEDKATLFAAMTMDRSENLVVQFTDRYNEAAHRLLATRNLAPKLFGPVSCGGTLKCIIMAKIEGETLLHYAGPISFVSADVKQAVQLLHDNGFVFGDLRSPNIIVYKSDGEAHAMFVDFDWCGKHGEDRYPPRLNDLEIVWLNGVVRGGLMYKKHDLEMIKRLQGYGIF